MPRLDEIRDDLIEALAARQGRPTAPPAALAGHESVTPFERLAWVALNQAASPKLAAAAFDALDEAGMLDPARLGPAHPLELDDILKQARVALAIKSLRPLQNLARWAVESGGPLTPESIAGLATETIRDEWRAINGIGLATADTLLLEGLGRASYPVDRATYRILVRHGWIDATADYDEARLLVERLARRRADGADLDDGATARVLLDLGRWFAQVGRESCKPTAARCERCPLRPWLPESGPVEVE